MFYRGEEHAVIRQRITELVNEIIQQEDPDASFSEQEILDLIGAALRTTRFFATNVPEFARPR